MCSESNLQINDVQNAKIQRETQRTNLFFGIKKETFIFKKEICFWNFEGLLVKCISLMFTSELKCLDGN